jgi:hypothetical protein
MIFCLSVFHGLVASHIPIGPLSITLQFVKTKMSNSYALAPFWPQVTKCDDRFLLPLPDPLTLNRFHKRRHRKCKLFASSLFLVII